MNEIALTHLHGNGSCMGDVQPRGHVCHGLLEFLGIVLVLRLELLHLRKCVGGVCINERGKQSW